MKYLGERVVELAKLQLGKWVIRNGRKGNSTRLQRSIKAKGIIEPLLVEEEGGHLILVDGHRRYQIAQELGLKEVRVVVVEGSEDELKELIAVRHNTHEIYGPLTRARMAKLLSHGMKLEQIAALLGCSVGYVSDLVHIWSLGNRVVRALEEGKLTVAHARLLLRLEPARREEILKEIIDRKLTVRQTKALIEGRAVLSIAELNKLMPPGVSLGSGNGSGGYMASIVFSSADELRSQLQAVLGILQGVDRLQEEPSEVTLSDVEVGKTQFFREEM